MQKGFSPIIVILAILVIAVGAFVGWRVLDASQSQKQSQQNNNTQSNNQNNQASTTFTLHIKELGVDVTLPNVLSDIEYTVSSTGKTDDGKMIIRASFSTKKIASLDPACSADGVAPPLGDLTRVEGQYPTNATATNSGGILVKQFPDFYIAKHSLQATCASSTGSAAETEAATSRAAFFDALSTLELSK